MWIILVSLCIGGLVGACFPFAKTLEASLSKVQLYCLYLIILLMGVKIGADPRIFDYAAALGLQALVLAFGAIMGSILLAFLGVTFFLKRREETANDTSHIDVSCSRDHLGQMDAIQKLDSISR